MTILDELIEYANLCLEDVKISEYEDYIISCKKHKNACKRFLKDIQNAKNNKDFEYFWDEIEAKKIVKWFSYLRHSKGVLAGKPIILISWQKFILCQVFILGDSGINYLESHRALIEHTLQTNKHQQEIQTAKEVWHMVDEKFRITDDLKELLKSKADEFDKILLNKFPYLTQSEITDIRQAIAGEINKGKDELNKDSLQEQQAKIMQQNNQLLTENSQLKNKIEQLQNVIK